MDYNVDEIVEHINTTGICVLEDYFTADECKAAVAELDNCFDKYTDRAYRVEAEGCGGDERLFRVERESTIAAKLAKDDLLEQVCSKYLAVPGKCGLVLGGRLTAEEGKSANSGGGWHRDSTGKQFKVLMYLTDVNEKNGPYMFMPRSTDTILDRRGQDSRDRFTDSAVKELCKSTNIDPFTVTGKAGTVVLTATNNIHRGAVIEEGIRYSLTNYYFPASDIANKKTRWLEWSVPELDTNTSGKI